MKIYYFEKKRVEADLDAQGIKDYEKHYGKLLKVIVDGNKVIKCRYDERQKDISEIVRFNK